MPSGLTAPSGATIPLATATTYKIDPDDVGIPGVRSFYIIVTINGGSTQTFGPYSLTLSCTVSGSTNVVPAEPAAISTSAT